METTRLKSSAHQKLSTANPETKTSTSKIMRALMTNRNSPNETKVMGNVRTTSIGLTNTFTIPNRIATIRAVQKPSKWTPGNILPVIQTASVPIKRFRSSLTVSG